MKYKALTFTFSKLCGTKARITTPPKSKDYEGEVAALKRAVVDKIYADSQDGSVYSLYGIAPRNGNT